VAKITRCPFCGYIPRLDPVDWKTEGDAWAAVSCDNDDCPVKPSLRNWANTALSGLKSHDAQVKAAIRKWNAALKANGPTV
jgi:hypothetical protein